MTACKMIEKRIVQLVTDSFGTQYFGKALDCVKAYREQAIKVWEFTYYSYSMCIFILLILFVYCHTTGISPTFEFDTVHFNILFNTISFLHD